MKFKILDNSKNKKDLFLIKSKQPEIENDFNDNVYIYILKG